MALKQHNLTCTGHTRPVVFLNFSGITDGKYYLISACKDGKPMLRQGETGDWIGTFEGHKGAVWGAALNVDASKAATGAADFSAKLWDATNGSELASLPHRHIVKSVSFSSDSSQLVTGSNEKLMRIFDLNRLDAEPLKINGHTSSIRHALFLNDDRWLLSASDDKTIRLWDLKSLQEIQRLEFSSIPNDLELSADKNLLTVASANSVSFHEINGLNKIKEYQVPTIVYTASLSPDKAVFVCGGEDFTMYKYQFEDGTELGILGILTKVTLIHCIVLDSLRTVNYTLVPAKMEPLDYGKQLSVKLMVSGGMKCNLSRSGSKSKHVIYGTDFQLVNSQAVKNLIINEFVFF